MKKTTPQEEVPAQTRTAEEREMEREEREYQLEVADRENIDKIILSNDVKKGGKIRIERKGPLDQAHQYVMTMPADSWKNTDDVYDYLKKMFGGGDYKCMTFRANGQMYKPFQFSIDYRFKGKLDEDEIKRMSETGGVKASDGAMAKIFDLMRTNQQDGLKLTDVISLMDKSSSRNDQTMVMMMTMMMKSMEASQSSNANMITAMATMFASMQSKQGSNGSMEGALIELLKQRSQTPMQETLTMMSQIKEIFGGEKEEKEDDMWSKLGRVAGPLLSGMMGGGAPQTRPAPQVSTDRQPAGAIPQGQPQQPRGLIAMMPVKYRILFELGLSAARRNSDPLLYADVIVDQLDDNSLKVLQETLTPDDWCVKLFGDESTVADIRPWLETLRTALITYEPASSTDPSASATGDQNTTESQPSGPSPDS